MQCDADCGSGGLQCLEGRRVLAAGLGEHYVGLDRTRGLGRLEHGDHMELAFKTPGELQGVFECLLRRGGAIVPTKNAIGHSGSLPRVASWVVLNEVACSS